MRNIRLRSEDLSSSIFAALRRDKGERSETGLETELYEFGYRMKKMKRDIRIETRTCKACWEDHIWQSSQVSSGKI